MPGRLAAAVDRSEQLDLLGSLGDGMGMWAQLVVCREDSGDLPGSAVTWTGPIPGWRLVGLPLPCELSTLKVGVEGLTGPVLSACVLHSDVAMVFCSTDGQADWHWVIDPNNSASAYGLPDLRDEQVTDSAPDDGLERATGPTAVALIERIERWAVRHALVVDPAAVTDAVSRHHTFAEFGVFALLRALGIMPSDASANPLETPPPGQCSVERTRFSGHRV